MTTTLEPRSQARLADALAKLRDDLPYFAKTHLRIKTKEAELLPFVFNPAQALVHKKLEDQKRKLGKVRAITLKARQEGISTYVAARYFQGCILWKYQNALIIADEKKRSQKLFNIYDTYHRNLPDWLRPTPRYASKQQSLWWDNEEGTGLDSQLEVNTANDTEAGRAGTLQKVHASELAFWFSAEETFGSLAESVPSHSGEIIIESTANGIGNFFHQTWEAAEAGESEYIAIFLPWWIHTDYTLKVSKEERADIRKTEDPWERKALDEGFHWEGKAHKLKPEQIAWRRMKLREPQYRNNPRKFQQEYPAEPNEAFISTGNGFFDEEALEKLNRECLPPKYRGNVIERSSMVTFRPQAQGYLRVWEMPDRKNGLYVIGADTAKGRQVAASSGDDSERGGSDFSCADVYDVHTRTFVAQLHGRMAPEEFARQIDLLGHLYCSESRDGSVVPALLGVEKNYSCVDDETEALTPDGWKRHSEIAEGDFIRTLNPETKLAEWQPVLRMNRHEVENELMFRADKHKHSSLTTWNHRWFVQRMRNGQGRLDTFTTSSEMRKHDRILCAAQSGDSPPEKVYDDSFVELVGWFWTEGTINKKGGGSVRLSQSNSHNPFYVKRIRELLTRLYGPPVERIRPGGNSKPGPQWRESDEDHGMKRWYLNAAAGTAFLEVAPDRIPTAEFIRSLTENQLWMFLQSSMSAEASWAKPEKQFGIAISQKRREPLDAVQMAATLWGIGSTVWEKPNGQWCLTFHKEKNVLPAYSNNGNGFHPQRYTGTVWCPTVENSVWLARRRGRVFYTGNSGETVLRKLKDANYPNLFYARQHNRRYNKVTPVLGWLTTSETRQPMLDELAEAVRKVLDEESEGVTIWNKDTVKEMRVFVRDQSGKPRAQEGAHDDRVMAAAVTLQVARWVSAPPKGQLPEMEVSDSPTGW